jgi:DNA-binding transcriptional LysR family regulator
MELADLRTFVTVIEETNFTRAATRLRRTQPAVSFAIRRLERATGARLLTRNNRSPVALTAEGERLVTYARRMLVMHDQARTAIVNLREIGPNGLVIGANDSLVGVLLPLIDAFRESHPGARIDLRRSRSRDIVADVLRQTLDVGVTTRKPDAGNVDALPIGQDDLVVIVAPSHPLAKRPSVAVRELAGQSFVAHSEPSADRARVLQLLESSALPHQIALAVPSLDALKRAIEVGMGITIMPRRCALTELQQRRLVAVRLEDATELRHMWLVSRCHANQTRMTTHFIEVVTRLTGIAAGRAPDKVRRTGRGVARR